MIHLSKYGERERRDRHSCPVQQYIARIMLRQRTYFCLRSSATRGSQLLLSGSSKLQQLGSLALLFTLVLSLQQPGPASLLVAPQLYQL